MRILLDTCTVLWIHLDAPELSPRARTLFTDPDNEVFLSAVSAWEIALKHRLGRLKLPEPPGSLLPALRQRYGIESLAIDEESALHMDRLPDLHRDPFDRILVCQAVVHGLAILSPDPEIARYAVRTLW